MRTSQLSLLVMFASLSWAAPLQAQSVKAGAPQGSRVHLVLTGPAARTIDVEVDERAAVVDELSGPPTLTVTMPAGVFARLAGGRADPETMRDQATVEGDVELGERLIANLGYTI